MSDKISEEVLRIRRILLHDWDPIGISHHENAADEYDTYADHVLRMVQSGADVKELIAYLYGVARTDIGLDYPGLLEKSESAALGILKECRGIG